MDVLITVQPDLDLYAAQNIPMLVENRPQGEQIVYTVHVHVEPGSEAAAVWESGQFQSRDAEG